MLTVSSVFKKSLLAVLVAALAGCGGGGGSSSGSSAPSTGNLSMQVTDGPGSDFDHVWVTIKAIAVHADADAVYGKNGSANWIVTTLASPVTVDLAQLNNGALSSVLSNITLPVGTYHQIRLFMVGADDTLTTSALATTDGETPAQALQWNDQVEYTDDAGSILESPLEVAYPTQGLQLNGTFTITSGSTLQLVVDFDLEHDVVPFKHGNMQGFTLKPNLHYFDLSQAGAIVGQVDKSQLCAVNGRGIPLTTTNCAFNLIAKAELLSSDGSRHFDARATSVNPQTGKFVLFPVPTKDSAGNALTYDVLVRGRQMDTMLVTGVAPASGGTPSSNATVVQTANIPLTINTSEYQAQFSSALDPLTSGHAIFQQTLTSGGVPYEIRWGNTDPFTGKLAKSMWLENGPVLVAPYNNADVLSFTPTTPVEGTNDSYTVGANESVYFDLADATSPVTSSTNLFVPPIPTLKSGISSGTINFNFTLANLARKYDHATLVLSRFANIVTTQDITTEIASGGAVTLGSVPAGSATNKVPGAYYFAYLRVWNSAHPFKSYRMIPVPAMIDLRATDTATVTVSLDGDHPAAGL